MSEERAITSLNGNQKWSITAVDHDGNWFGGDFQIVDGMTAIARFDAEAFPSSPRDWQASAVFDRNKKDVCPGGDSVLSDGWLHLPETPSAPVSAL